MHVLIFWTMNYVWMFTNWQFNIYFLQQCRLRRLRWRSRRCTGSRARQSQCARITERRRRASLHTSQISSILTFHRVRQSHTTCFTGVFASLTMSFSTWRRRGYGLCIPFREFQSCNDSRVCLRVQQREARRRSGRLWASLFVEEVFALSSLIYSQSLTWNSCKYPTIGKAMYLRV